MNLFISRDDRENDVSTHCRLVTLEPDSENLELSINDEPNLSQRAIMKVIKVKRKSEEESSS